MLLRYIVPIVRIVYVQQCFLVLVFRSALITLLVEKEESVTKRNKASPPLTSKRPPRSRRRV